MEGFSDIVDIVERSKIPSSTKVLCLVNDGVSLGWNPNVRLGRLDWRIDQFAFELILDVDCATSLACLQACKT